MSYHLVYSSETVSDIYSVPPAFRSSTIPWTEVLSGVCRWLVGMSPLSLCTCREDWWQRCWTASATMYYSCTRVFLYDNVYRYIKSTNIQKPNLRKKIVPCLHVLYIHLQLKQMQKSFKIHNINSNKSIFSTFATNVLPTKIYIYLHWRLGCLGISACVILFMKNKEKRQTCVSSSMLLYSFCMSATMCMWLNLILFMSLMTLMMFFFA